VLFVRAIAVINPRSTATAAGRLKAELKKYTTPALLILDALGDLPIDQAGADLLFHVIALRYAQGASVLTSNRAFQAWPTICNTDSPLPAAILDRLLHHADTSVIEGKRFRMQDQLESALALRQGSLEAHIRFWRSPDSPCISHIFKPPTP
jgi:DNA replication protein DnaC